MGLFWVDMGQQSEKVPESGFHYLSVCLSVTLSLCHSVSVSLCLSICRLTSAPRQSDYK